jgi:sarcosine oxidase subunit alpha
MRTSQLGATKLVQPRRNMPAYSHSCQCTSHYSRQGRCTSAAAGLLDCAAVPRDSPRLSPGAARGAPLAIDFEGRSVRAFDGEPVAVALFAGGVRVLGRSSKYHRPRGIFCLDGHCASCYLRIDGRPNQRACMTPARAGLRCERQNAFPNADIDLLRAADWLFPEGMDHHTLMTGTRVGNQLFLKLVRQMGGSGTLPDSPAQDHPARADAAAGWQDCAAVSDQDQVVDLCVVGGGPAGLAAARAAAEAAPAARVVLFDEQSSMGGSLLAEPGGTERGARLAGAARGAGVRLVERATAIAYYPEDVGADGQAGLLAVVTPEGLRRVSARRFLYATGAYDQNLPFADNDRPGIVSARACGRLVFHHGVRPVRTGGRVVILGAARYAATLAGGLAAAGIDAELIDLEAGDQRVTGAHGRQQVSGVEIARTAGGGDQTRLVKGQLVAVAALPAPASELARQHGAAVTMDPVRGGFAVNVDAAFRSTAPGVYACGDVTGFAGPEAALAAGTAAGRSLAAELFS